MDENAKTSSRQEKNVNGVQSVAEGDYGRRISTGEGNDVSFLGNEIPEVVKHVKFNVSDGKQVIDKILGMSEDERSKVTIEAANFDNWTLRNVKLSTGDIVPVETAMALAKNHMLTGYSVGKTVRGGMTLRSKPDPKNVKTKGIYDLPKF
jgi:hypothetical protein